MTINTISGARMRRRMMKKMLLIRKAPSAAQHDRFDDEDDDRDDVGEQRPARQRHDARRDVRVMPTPVT